MLVDDDVAVEVGHRGVPDLGHAVGHAVVFYGAGYGPPHTKLEDAIADAERSIFASAYNQIIALGGWDAVAAVAAAAAAAAATRPTRSGS